MKTDNQIFNPANLPKDLLIENFVVRTKVFEKIFRDIKTGKMKFPEQHYIVQGTRGMGKTTLLLRLKYEIENSADLNNWLMPVFFGEETYDVSSISNLWEKLMKYLDDFWQTGGSLYKQTAQFVGNDDYEKKCYQVLKGALQERKKKIILFFDNFGELFFDYLSEEESHRLREILMNCNDIRIIAASAVVIKDLHDYSKPFFDFFKIIHLEGLSKEEALQLIAKMQEKDEKKIDLKKQKAKIETLAVLSGGVIRTIVLLYEVLLADEDGSALKYLDSILNWLTPLYKHRMEDLPVQQRKIVSVIAKQWDAISTKEIAEKIRENGKPLNSKLVSAQLTQLEKNNIVEKKTTSTKNHLYQVRERFFNIWYLMRNGDSYDKKRVIWLTRFLEAWYDDKSIGSFIDRHIAKLRTGRYDPNSALLIAEAVSNARDLEIEKQHELIEETKKILPEALKEKLPESFKYKFEEGQSFYNVKEYEIAFDIFNAIPGSESLAMKGFCKLKLGRYSDGVKLLEKAFKGGQKYAAKALAVTYETELEDYRNALHFYLMDVKEGNYSSYLDIANLLASKLNDVEASEKYYRKALELKVEGVEILFGLFYQNYKGDFDKAASLYEAALDGGDDRVLVLLGEIKYRNGEIELAIALLKRAIEKNIQPHEAHFILGGIYLMKLNDKVNAERNFAACLKFGESHFNEKFILAVIYFSMHENKELALDYIESAFELFSSRGSVFWLTMISVWNNQFEKLSLFFEELKSNKFDNQDGKISQLLTLLLTKKQYHLALNYFNDEYFDFKDKFKPLYYALMYYLKEEFPNEFIKMGKELEQPVNEIIENIESLRERYY